MATIDIDSRGSACPGPITDLARAYKSAANGDMIVLLATDDGIKSDAKAWCDRTGNQLVGIDEKDGVYTVSIKITAKK
ncbi:SirA family protein [mine drainage metagenome]|uniref:SirA family protein n=1 Tax=mine drainage metagenome TaxID=410659 RepID=T1B8F4_9ZZZZ